MNRNHTLSAGRNHKINDFLNLRPGRVNRHQNGIRTHAVRNHQRVTRVVHGTVNQVTDISDGLNQRVNQGVLTAVGLHLKTGDAELRIR